MTVVPGENHPADGGNENDTVPTRFTIQDTNCKLLLTSTSSAERILWLRKLEEARKHCLLTERAVLQRQRSSSQSFLFLINLWGSIPPKMYCCLKFNYNCRACLLHKWISMSDKIYKI
jgi:hypothetical protein